MARAGRRPQANRTYRTSIALTDAEIVWPIEAESILPPLWHIRREARLDEFIACFEGLEDPRSGIAALHDFDELLIIALCAVLSGVARYPG